LLKITWQIGERPYRPEFYVPEPVRVIGQANSFSRHVVAEIRRVSTEAYCKKLRVSPALKETVRCMKSGAVTVEEMMQKMYRAKDTIKEYRGKLLDLAREMELPALDTPLKVAVFLSQDGLG
jgi:hypothetical protein